MVYDGGVASIRIGGRWLDVNGCLPVCVAKPPKRVDQIDADQSVPAIVDFARAILETPSGGASPLSTWISNRAGLVVFPEYTFSSSDFGELDALVKTSRDKLIVLAGFGAVRGSALQDFLSQGCIAGWDQAAIGINAAGKYNAAWCWIHEGAGATRCFIFAKNFIDQVGEISGVQNLMTVHSVLKVETDDLVLYPLICSDLISEEPDSPRVRIRRSIGSPPNSKDTLLCTLSCNSAPESRRWRAAIDDAVSLNQQGAVLLFANQPVTEPKAAEELDRWRCLTGVFVSQSRMRQPRLPLPQFRYVETEAAAAGLILRCPDEGVAVGAIRWDLHGSSTGLHTWEPIVRLRLIASGWEPIEWSIGDYETRRYLHRRRGNILSRFPKAAGMIGASLTQWSQSTSAREVTPRLWPELLDGPKPPVPPTSPDALHQDSAVLDLAMAALAAVQSSTQGSPLFEGPERGQLVWSGTELRVWRSPRLSEDQMRERLCEIALHGGHDARLVFIARGNNEGPIVGAQVVRGAQRVVPDGLTDVTVASPDTVPEGDIEVPKQRPIYWAPLSDLEGILLRQQTDLPAAVRGAIETILTLT
jgi:hypothetical protein